MIYDTIDAIGQYKGISRWLDKAIACIETTSFDALELGTYEVDGKNVFYMVQAPELKSERDAKWELHKRYIDIQIGLADGEGIGYMPVAELQGWEDYNEVKDVAKASSGQECVMLPLKRGRFSILFPQDAHQPCVSLKEAVQGKKVVFKVLVEA